MRHFLLTISLIFGATAVSSFEPLSQKESIELIERGTIIDEHVHERRDFAFKYRKSLTVLEKGNVYHCIITNTIDSYPSIWVTCTKRKEPEDR